MNMLTRDIRALRRKNGSGNEPVARRRPNVKGARRRVKPGCRPALFPFERVRILLLLAVVFGVLFLVELTSNPLMTAADAFASTMQENIEIPLLFIAELTRQLLIFAAEKVSRFYSLVLFTARFVNLPFRRVSERGRQNIGKLFFWMFALLIYAVIAAKFTGAGLVGSIFMLPKMIFSAMPLILQLVFGFFFVIIQFVGLFWFLSRGGVETYYPEDIKTRFEQVWGQDHVVSRLKENLVLLEDPESIEARGGHVPSGILLWGPPGTGKTLMAEAIAGETGKPYVFVDPGAFTNMFMGVGILKVKGLFRKLRKLSTRFGGVIVFFDEADSLGSRGGVVSRKDIEPAESKSVLFDSCHAPAYFSGHVKDAIGITQDKVMMGGMMGGGGSGTLQALLTELQGLKKPRGFLNRVVRRALGMRPSQPPKYRILVMMATNMPDSLDPALLRPGRIDRIYRVGYPSKEGRIRTYQGYFAKVNHNLSEAEIDRLATSTPYATGAKIKDMVNEALISALGRGSDVITWEDVVKAKHLKELGPSEGVVYNEREQHSVAIHEACHAVIAYRLRKHLAIDVATIEKGSDYLGMVSSIPFEEMFSAWSSYYESDIAVALASLAGERMFFDGDSTSGVSGDLDTATRIAALMESRWGMGATIASASALADLQAGQPLPLDKKKIDGRMVGERVEARLNTIYESTRRLLEKNRHEVLAVAHALEKYKTLTGPDVEAVINGTHGPLIDGSIYANKTFRAQLETYHKEVVTAHKEHRAVEAIMPSVETLTKKKTTRRSKSVREEYQEWPEGPRDDANEAN